jgi:hypothetical protein
MSKTLTRMALAHLFGAAPSGCVANPADAAPDSLPLEVSADFGQLKLEDGTTELQHADSAVCAADEVHCGAYSASVCHEMFPPGTTAITYAKTDACCGCATCDCGQPCARASDCQGPCVVCQGEDCARELGVEAYCWLELSKPLGCWILIDDAGERFTSCGG